MSSPQLTYRDFAEIQRRADARKTGANAHQIIMRLNSLSYGIEGRLRSEVTGGGYGDSTLWIRVSLRGLAKLGIPVDDYLRRVES